MRKSLNTFVALTTLFACACICEDSCLIASTATKNVVLDFTVAAKKAIPAVVSIKIKGAQAKESDQDDAFNRMNDSFFQKFFGINPRSRALETPQVRSQGSGFIISEDGHILTNQHVVKDAGEITVILEDGREFIAKVIGQDPNTDVALIKIDANNLPKLSLVNSDELEVGQWVAAVGNPLGLQATVTAGIVSAKGRNNLDIENIEDFIQTDAPVNLGNSGGPLLDLDGNVIGMTTAIATQAGSTSYMGISFAIPSNLVKHVMDEILTKGTVSRGYLGFTMQAVDKDIAQAFGVNKTDGALIVEIVPGSPANKIGLKQGDIILRINEKPVKNIAGLRNTIALISPGTTISVDVLRDGSPQKFSPVVEDFPTKVEKAELTQIAGKYGFSVETLTSEIAKKYNITEEKGVVISKVNSGSPASWAGLRAGAIILSVNREDVQTVDDYNRILNEAEKNAPVLFLIKQGSVKRFLSLRIE
ncbi:MAG: Do family serine endopeptidase [Parachlamydiales bacterium]|jgi:serine protease Do